MALPGFPLAVGERDLYITCEDLIFNRPIGKEAVFCLQPVALIDGYSCCTNLACHVQVRWGLRPTGIGGWDDFTKIRLVGLVIRVRMLPQALRECQRIREISNSILCLSLHKEERCTQTPQKAVTAPHLIYTKFILI